CAFKAINVPPTLVNGKHSSDKTGKLATARAVTISKLSRAGLFFAPKSSALACVKVTSVKPNLPTSSAKNLIRLFKESTIVTFNDGNKIFKGRLGKPAPAPTSHSDNDSFFNCAK